MAYWRLSALIQVEGVLQHAARREDKTERLKREQDARNAVLSLYADRFADHVGVLPGSHARPLLAAQVYCGLDLAEPGVREKRCVRPWLRKLCRRLQGHA